MVKIVHAADFHMDSPFQSLPEDKAAQRRREQRELLERLAAVQALRSEKYDTWAWNYGRSPKYTRKDRRRFEGGTLETRVNVEQGLITDIVFYGDFLAVSPLDGLCQALKGCPFRREDVRAVLERFPVGELFGAIRADQVMDTLFASGEH